MTIRQSLVLLSTSLALVGCTATGSGEIERRAPPSALAVGTGGVLAGEAVGRSLDAATLREAVAAETEAYATGTVVNWRAETGNAYGQAAPGPLYTYAGASCRNYTHTIFIDGTAGTARGRACIQPDGAWRPVAAG